MVIEVLKDTSNYYMSDLFQATFLFNIKCFLKNGFEYYEIKNVKQYSL
jgi:hypothetical protein